MSTGSHSTEAGGSDVDESFQFYRDAAVPIRPTQEEIALRAYELFLKRGSSPGSETEDWLQAEKELIAEYNSRGIVAGRSPPRAGTSNGVLG